MSPQPASEKEEEIPKPPESSPPEDCKSKPGSSDVDEDEGELPVALAEEAAAGANVASSSNSSVVSLVPFDELDA
jgi:hypothetical protein